MECALPSWHKAAHESKCQVLLSTTWKPGFRGLDLENMERLWAQLKGKQTITKEMRPSGRQDLISDALIDVGEKIVENFGNSNKSFKSNINYIHAIGFHITSYDSES